MREVSARPCYINSDNDSDSDGDSDNDDDLAFTATRQTIVKSNEIDNVKSYQIDNVTFVDCGSSCGEPNSNSTSNYCESCEEKIIYGYGCE